MSDKHKQQSPNRPTTNSPVRDRGPVKDDEEYFTPPLRQPPPPAQPEVKDPPFNPPAAASTDRTAKEAPSTVDFSMKISQLIAEVQGRNGPKASTRALVEGIAALIVVANGHRDKVAPSNLAAALLTNRDALVGAVATNP